MLLKSIKIGFIGTGNMGQAIIKGLVQSKTISPNNIHASNRSFKKLERVSKMYGVHAFSSNHEVVEKSDIVVIAVKPQDFFDTLDPIARDFDKNQIVISLAAGVSLKSIEKILPHCRLARIMPNTPILISKGVLGFCTLNNDEGLIDLIEQLLQPLGVTLHLSEGDPFDSLIVSCGCGTGFVFELMKYWQDWIVDYGIDEETARQMTVQTFLGAVSLAQQSENISFDDLQAQVTSKQGVTEAGLTSMREQELERVFRIAFEKALLRNNELSQTS